MATESLSYMAIRSANQAREADEQRQESRKRNLLVLILHHLNSEGYVETANHLESEGNISSKKFTVCDNIDLSTILQEYESYYFVKFQKVPKITRKVMGSDDVINSNKKMTTKRSMSNSVPCLPRITQSSQENYSAGQLRKTSTTGNTSATQNTNTSSKQSPLHNGQQKTTNITTPTAATNSSDTKTTKLQDNKDTVKKVNGAIASNSSESLNCADVGLSVSQLGAAANSKPKHPQIIDMKSLLKDAIYGDGRALDPNVSEKIVKPLGAYLGYNSEWRDLAQAISKDIYLDDPDVRWDDIIGLDDAKRLVKEAVIYPIKYPQLFTGILSPWKGLLLYGPPGTGKTMLAKAVATQCNTTFFNISASSIVSKWRGDSEKLIRVLFELARFHAPSTIFLDELESVMSQRGGDGAGEHEGSRRMKTELLVQMDGLAKSDDLVFLLAASNLPWMLDHAMLRRLEKRILVDLPNNPARKCMIQKFLPPVINPGKNGSPPVTTDLDYDLLAQQTSGYTGADIKLVCKEAAMRPVRKIFDILESYHSEMNPKTLTAVEALPLITVETVTTQDFNQALKRMKPSASQLKDKYIAWQKEYESV